MIPRPSPSALRLAGALVVLGALVGPAGGAVAQPGASNVTELGVFDPYDFYSDVWGYVDSEGREIAIVGLLDGTAFVDASDPTDPVELVKIPGPLSVPRDIKTYGSYAYISNESGGGLQIVDLEAPGAPTLVASDSTWFRTAHNLWVDEARALLYVAGSDNGLRVLSLADPLHPVSTAYSYTTYYVHDVYAAGNIAYFSYVELGKVAVANVGGLPSVPTVGSAFTPGFTTHNAWATGSGFLLTSDEVPGGHVSVFDVTNPAAPVAVGEWKHPDAPNSIIHNVTVRGSRAYVAWYHEGLQVLDIASPQFPQRVGWFDTLPDSSSEYYDGAWGVYPLQPSGTIYVSDMSTGLHFLSFDPDYGWAAGTVADAGSGAVLPGATVTPLGGTDAVTTLGNGFFRLALPPGTHTVACSAYGFSPDTVSVDVAQGATTLAAISLQPLPSGSIRGFVGETGSYTPLPGVEVRIQGTPLAAVSDAAGNYRLDDVPAGTYLLEADLFGCAPFQGLVLVGPGDALVKDVALNASFYVDDLENTSGWVLGAPGDDATSGTWELAVPQETGCGRAQPAHDHSPDPGNLAFVTGATAGTWMGSHDVDGGKTTLLSPVLDLGGLQNPVLRFHRWYTNDAGANPDNDVFQVDASPDAGQTWVPLLATKASYLHWVETRIALDQALEVTGQMRFRFVASDLAGGSIVEALIDDIDIYGVGASVGVPGPRPPAPPVRLLPAAPNPFQAETVFRFRLDAPVPVQLGVFDLAGRLVRPLQDGPLDPGDHAFTWDGVRADGRPSPAGMYFVRLRTPGHEDRGKVLLTR